jgi:alpha-mannosidase
MIHARYTKLIFAGLASLFLFASLHAAEKDAKAELITLWEIGTKDRSAAELALGPAGYEQFAEDPLFIVGVSDAKKDWPYVQPGPSDAWAKSQRHAFSICFALKEKPANKCVLAVAVVDAHSQFPPTIDVRVNGRRAGRQRPPAGKSDAALRGDADQGQASEFTIDIPADLLRAGNNEIALATISGSWIVYDSLRLQAPLDAALAPVNDFAIVKSAENSMFLVGKEGELNQNVRVNLLHYGKEAQAALKIEGSDPIVLPVSGPREELSFWLRAVEKDTPASVEITAGGKVLAQRELIVKPVRKWTVYLLPHSHVDIGYTDLQPDVEKKHWRHLETAVELAKKSAGNPPGAQFKWNAEVLWAVDSYLREAPPEKQQAMVEAIKAGHIELDAFYGNELTALCRPEELMRLVEAASRIGRRCGVKVESAMISDVPGYTWGLVPVLASAGVKYFSVGPNPSDRIGRTLADLGDKPFYWISPSGKEKVLCWIAGTSYGSLYNAVTLAVGGEKPLADYLKRLEKEKYPYDCVQVRYTIQGDNGPPDASLADSVKKWNEEYAYPKLVIATTTEMMKDFESRYGDKLPRLQGDVTPYWEDGAASSARETGINRAAAERLAQAETLWALTDYQKYPSDAFSAAWRNVLLYDEHTWGAWNSISEPDHQFVKNQWKIKQAFALDADAQSKKLLEQVADPRGKLIDEKGRFQVFNACGWPRTDLVILPKESTAASDAIVDKEGRIVHSQRLQNGELAFLAKDVPALGCKSYRLQAGKTPVGGLGFYRTGSLTSDKIVVKLDEKTGDITSLKKIGLEKEFVDQSSGSGLNRYYYVLGADAMGAQTSGPAKISVKEAGPLVISWLVESDAPGCNMFTREIRVTSGLDRVDIFNVIDKKPIREKEGVHLAYPFDVPEGKVHLDLAWAVTQPESSQLPGSCKNWFTVQRWVDVSNQNYGVTWATIDAPLVEIGRMSGNLIGSQSDPAAWINHLEPSQKLYSWVMNNHWHTNYRAEQEGTTPFRYSIRPHDGGYDAVAAMRFGIEQSQPLVVVNASIPAPGLLSLENWPDNVIIASMKPSGDGQAIILRLYEVGGKTTEVNFRWKDSQPKAVWLSNPYEEPVSQVNGAVAVPGHGVITLRAEF